MYTSHETRFQVHMQAPAHQLVTARAYMVQGECCPTCFFDGQGWFCPRCSSRMSRFRLPPSPEINFGNCVVECFQVSLSFNAGTSVYWQSISGLLPRTAQVSSKSPQLKAGGWPLHRSRFVLQQQTLPSFWAKGIWCVSGRARLLHSVRRPTRRDRSLLSIPSLKVLATTCLVRTLSQISFRFPVPLVPFAALAGVFVWLVFFPRSHCVHSSSQGRLGLHSSCCTPLSKFFSCPCTFLRCTCFPMRWLVAISTC